MMVIFSKSVEKEGEYFLFWSENRSYASVYLSKRDAKKLAKELKEAGF